MVARGKHPRGSVQDRNVRVTELRICRLNVINVDRRVASESSHVITTGIGVLERCISVSGLNFRSVGLKPIHTIRVHGP